MRSGHPATRPRTSGVMNKGQKRLSGKQRNVMQHRPRPSSCARSTRFKSTLPLFLALLWVASGIQLLADTNTWNGGAGSWFDPAKWSLGVVPNNGATNYSVRIDGLKPGSSSVSFDSFNSASIDDLRIDPGDSLTLQNGSSLGVFNGITMNGTLTVASDGSFTDLQFSGDQTLGGNGQ